MTTILHSGQLIPFKSFTFSGGEVSVKLESSLYFNGDLTRPFTITSALTSSDKIMELAMITDALRRQYGASIKIELYIPYLPYARQDRVCAPGESLSLAVIAQFINSLKFDVVRICDVHSDVALALIDRVKNVEVQDILNERLVGVSGDVVLVAPDAGAIKKVLKVSQKTGLPMVRADKIRDVSTGAITDTVVYSDHIGNKSFLIVDDICDGGRTFIELEKKLRPLTDAYVYLYVTHGIFSKGLEPLGCFNKVFTAFPFPNVDETNPLLEII
jgi:ribose-phosphate pyrophosphokinase